MYRCIGCLGFHLCSLPFFHSSWMELCILADLSSTYISFSSHVNTCWFFCCCCCCSSGKSSTVLVMGDSFSLARDDGCSCKPVSSWITLLNFHAICPVWGQLICSCSGCSSKDPGLVADSSSAPATLWSVKESSKKSSCFGVVFVLRPEMLRAH